MARKRYGDTTSVDWIVRDTRRNKVLGVFANESQATEWLARHGGESCQVETIEWKFGGRL